jgi:transposase
MSPEYVRPYVKSQKNDDRDAEAIAEAATRPTMRFVALKSEEQLDMQTLHRARDRLVGERTALINQLRAVLLERGITVAQGRRKLERHLAGLNGPEGLSQRMRVLIEDMRLQWSELDRRIAELDKELAEWVRNEEAARRLMSIPGIGVLNACADRGHRPGRELCAWTGLGGVARLGAAAGNNRRQTASGRNQQAGQQVSPQAFDPWCAGRLANAA